MNEDKLTKIISKLENIETLLLDEVRDSLEKEFFDKSRTIKFSLWNSLLIFNGVLIGVFSFTIPSPVLKNTLILLCLLSAIVIIFINVKLETDLGLYSIALKDNITPECKADTIAKAKKAGRLMICLSKLSVILSGIVAFVFFIYLFIDLCMYLIKILN